MVPVVVGANPECGTSGPRTEFVFYTTSLIAPAYYVRAKKLENQRKVI